MSLSYALKKLSEGLRTGDGRSLAIGGGMLLFLWYRRSSPERVLLGTYKLKPGQELTIKGSQRQERSSARSK